MTGTERGLRIGLIGLGRIGAFHLRTLAGLPEVTITVADADAALAARVAEAHGVSAAPTAAALLESGLDAAVIATATPGHAPLLHLAATAGVPAFCEKPVALELAALDAVIEEVAAAGILVQVGCQR